MKAAILGILAGFALAFAFGAADVAAQQAGGLAGGRPAVDRVGELELQPGIAGARRSANFFFADKERRRYCLAVRKVGDELGFHEPPTFGSGSFFLPFPFSGVSGVGATS